MFKGYLDLSLRKIILFIVIIIIFFSLFNIYNIYSQEIEQKEISEVVNEKYKNEKFNQLISINDDTVGWIRVPNTTVDYPVVKSTDNEFYLDKDFYKNDNNTGSIFMDYRNIGDGEDKNMIIYGHHTLNGTMFTELEKYKDEEFLINNPYLYFDTPYGNFEYKIFSVYVTDNNFEYYKINFIYNHHFETFLKEIKQHSYAEIEMDLDINDNIITLSTCSYEFNGAKLVIHGKRIS